ncbi:hypothetical protein N9570_02410 [Candidatus Pelagibacter sp.]|nr:hypothetical protein [Candidatus Pelagibacter sp.]
MIKNVSELPSVDQLPDGISVDEKSFKYKNKIFQYSEIRSIRIFSRIQKMTLNLMPMPTQVDSVLTVFDKDNKKIKIKLIYQRFGFKRKNKELQLQNMFLFCRFLEKKTAEQRFKYYTDTSTKVILFKYKANGLLENNFEVLKDGSIRKNGKDFASLDPKQFDIWRSYKKLNFTKKTGWFKNKDIDISIDEDIFLFMISDYFDLDIPFREIED